MSPTQRTNRQPSDPNRDRSVLFGASYYAEYRPRYIDDDTDRLESDMSLMEQAGMNVIRVGESVWSHWEPEDGRFDLDWLEPVLDAAARHGICAIIGVPTYAVPLWLARKYPEIGLRDMHDHATAFGGREEASMSHPAFRWYAERIIRAIVTRYRDHGAVIGWQLHNEPGIAQNRTNDAFEGFKDWLRHRYGTVEELNRQWGTAYWSHELSTWDDLWRPEGNAQPQYDIEWHIYQASLAEESLAWERAAIDGLRRPDQFVTVNIAIGRYALDEGRVPDLLDVASADPYIHMGDGLRLPGNTTIDSSWITSGAVAPSLLGDRMFSFKQAPFMVAETNGGPIDGPARHYPGYHGQWRQVGWQFVARGARMISYWPWQQIHFGTETFWGGILPHDMTPGRVYQEVSVLGRELARAGARVTGLEPDADIAMVYSVRSRWALTQQPHTCAGEIPYNPAAYDELFRAFYDGAVRSGRQVRIVQDTQLVDMDADAARFGLTAGSDAALDMASAFRTAPCDFAAAHPVLVAAGLYVATDAMLEWLRSYVVAGGHLIIGPRTGYADGLARARTQSKPSRLEDLAGAGYQESWNLDAPITLHARTDDDAGFRLREGSQATIWLDSLVQSGEPTDRHALAGIDPADNPHFAQYPVITSNALASGRVTMVATVPNTALAASIYDFALPGSPWSHALFDHPTVTHSSAVNEDGERIHWLFNWSWNPVCLDLPDPLARWDDGERTSTVTLGAWDVAMFVE
ncbi:beta-galactosidase [Bifidobacterium eulemuris]|uniref:beta-galactosidase n=1 Tax=Bifidobacterium eulemuris TaxID=1765219 RepID=A0A261FY12_9BIFI|nr:alpha-amylase family protein [Bifidobacterium eulemuris]OZG64069.1 beta-galactosidase [Bifidobacterium eulemuris]QOL32574.1 beta-galactosidase [Bifidobacterium eulemuris]